MANSGTCPNIPLEAFSKVVEAIYDCAIDPSRWNETVKSIADLCLSECCALGVHDYTNGHTELAFQAGYDPEEFRRTHEGSCKGLNPFFTPLQLLPVGSVATRSMLIDDREFYESRFYREWAEPQGLHDGMGVKVLQTDQRAGLLAVNRLVPRPSYSDADVHLLSLLSPHICRALTISDALNLKTVRSEAFEATLDALTSGVFLADRHGRVSFMNRAAERQLRTGNSLRVENNRLVAVDRAARAALSAALAAAVADEAEGPAGEISLAIPAAEGAGLVATILPLGRGERRNVCGAFVATVAVFVQDPIVVPPLPGEAFAKLYGLTGGELRVLLAMAPGLGVKEAAEMLGISEATAKTHLQRIFAKTGTSKQTELMHLLISSTPPVRMA